MFAYHPCFMGGTSPIFWNDARSTGSGTCSSEGVHEISKVWSPRFTTCRFWRTEPNKIRCGWRGATVGKLAYHWANFGGYLYSSIMFNWFINQQLHRNSFKTNGDFHLSVASFHMPQHNIEQVNGLIWGWLHGLINKIPSNARMLPWFSHNLSLHSWDSYISFKIFPQLYWLV